MATAAKPTPAPIAGRIGRSNVTDGALVAAYQPLALATIQQLGQKIETIVSSEK